LKKQRLSAPPFFVLITFLLASPAFAQSIDVARWFGPEVGNRKVLSRYALNIYADSDVEGQDTNLGLIEHDFFLMAPVWQNERNEFGITARVELQDTDTDAVLPREGIPLPGQLWEVRVGGNYRGVLRKDWVWGVNASFGSASNEPFQAGDAFDAATSPFRPGMPSMEPWAVSSAFRTRREMPGSSSCISPPTGSS
jgi:hypothetical protein